MKLLLAAWLISCSFMFLVATLVVLTAIKFQ